MRLNFLAWLAIAGSALVGSVSAAAQERPVLLRDSFPLGSDGGLLCQVQDRSISNPARQSIFDRAWAVVCRDSARPVATIYAFRNPGSEASSLIAPHRREPVDCTASGTTTLAFAGSSKQSCAVSGTQLRWSVYSLDQGDTVFVAEGFEAYDSATELAMRSLLENRVVDGTIDVATTSVTDPFSFARIQAQTLEPGQALAEGYRRNLGGEYAEAAAYFETLEDRLAGQSEDETRINPGEFLVNRALQKSNLGEFAEAERLFAQAAPLTAGDPIAARLQRNFEAIHLLNRGDYAGAIAAADLPINTAVAVGADGSGLSISRPLATRLNSGSEEASLLGFTDELKLTEAERAQIIDAQALQLKGTGLRLAGRPAEARNALLEAYTRAVEVREGRVTSIVRLRAQVLGDLASLALSQGDVPGAEAYLRNAVDILELQYPERRAVSSAKARLASLLLATDRQAEAVGLYSEVIDRASGKSNATVGFENQLAPYFGYLAPRVASDAGAAEDFFRATQILTRPGVAETKAILARELSAGSGDAARLFRQSRDLSRDIERTRIRLLAAQRAEETAATQALRSELSTRIEQLESQQVRTQAELSRFPQYRAVAPTSLSLERLQSAMRSGEAYARLAMVGARPFMFFTDAGGSHAYPLDVSERDLERLVDELRTSISVVEDGEFLTYPYDVEAARNLYRTLFAPVESRIAASDHLIFEPDGAMLRLPIDILVADDASVQQYLQRVDAGADEYDFTGVNWLARQTRVSTAVAAQSFVESRDAPASTASREYLGLGSNTPLGERPPDAIRARFGSSADGCNWNEREWNNPIDAGELRVASQLVGGSSELLLGDNFTDSGLMARGDLDEYRILHFATHGLVTPPAPPCPARPALLTSFGDGESDGLLSFTEIFDLDLDADLVILSACDTAGEASIAATREAGVGSGGGTALDGLVRSFIGAGGRSVMASHWPAPDDFDATARLMNGLFRNGQTVDLGTALRQSQQALMQEADTSHPFYWGGFAIIGDAARPLLARQSQAARTDNGMIAGSAGAGE